VMGPKESGDLGFWQIRVFLRRAVSGIFPEGWG
jgi:hypothetical protein